MSIIDLASAREKRRRTKEIIESCDFGEALSDILDYIDARCAGMKKTQRDELFAAIVTSVQESA